MTTRARRLTILLDKDYREDDLGAVIAALKSFRFVQEVGFAESLDGNAIAASDFRRQQGVLISEIATSDGPLDSVHQRDFMASVRAAYAQLKAKRGY